MCTVQVFVDSVRHNHVNQHKYTSFSQTGLASSIINFLVNLFSAKQDFNSMNTWSDMTTVYDTEHKYYIFQMWYLYLYYAFRDKIF